MAALAETFDLGEERPIFSLVEDKSDQDVKSDEDDANEGFTVYASGGEAPGIPPGDLFAQIIATRQNEFKQLGRKTVAYGLLSYNGLAIEGLHAHLIKRIRPVKGKPGMARLHFREPILANITIEKDSKSRNVDTAIVHLNAIESYRRNMKFIPRH